MHRDSEEKSKRKSHMLPKELKSNTKKRCIGGNTFYIVKKTKADKGARKLRSQRNSKIVQTTFK